MSLVTQTLRAFNSLLCPSTLKQAFTDVLYERDLKRAYTEYAELYNLATAMCPSGIVSGALDDVSGLMSGYPQLDEIKSASAFLSENIQQAIENGDFNRAMDNTWDPSVFQSSI